MWLCFSSLAQKVLLAHGVPGQGLGHGVQGVGGPRRGDGLPLGMEFKIKETKGTKRNIRRLLRRVRATNNTHNINLVYYK